MRTPVIVLLILSLALVLPGPCGADDRPEASFGGDRFVAGDDVSLTGPVEGDAFVAGGRSEISGRVAGDAIVTGGTVEIRGEVDEDVYAAGGDLRIDAIIRGDLHAAGGTISVEREAQVQGDATVAGGNIDVEGSVLGELQAFGGRVELNAAVGGDVDIAAEDIRIGPDARIGGRVLYRSPNRPAVAEGAVIVGGLEKRERVWKSLSPESGVGRVVTGIVRTLWFTGALLLGAVLVVILPGFTREAAATVRSETLASIGLGVGLLLAVPVLAVLLFITIIGIPLGFAVLLGYGLLLMLGYLTAALSLGDWALSRARPGDAVATGWRILFLLVALVGISLVRLVPWVGDLAVFVLFLAGLGAFALRSMRGYRQQPPPP